MREAHRARKRFGKDSVVDSIYDEVWMLHSDVRKHFLSRAARLEVRPAMARAILLLHTSNPIFMLPPEKEEQSRFAIWCGHAVPTLIVTSIFSFVGPSIVALSGALTGVHIPMQMILAGIAGGFLCMALASGAAKLRDVTSTVVHPARDPDFAHFWPFPSEAALSEARNHPIFLSGGGPR